MSLDQVIVRKVITNKLQHDNFDIKCYTYKPIKTDGIMGEYYTLTCSINEQDNPTSKEHNFFVKKQPPHIDEETKVIYNNVFIKEVDTFRMFETINHPTLNASVPKCYYSDYESLILEDLRLEGYECMTSQRVATEDEIYLILKTLAGMHAAGIAYEEQETAKNSHLEPVRLNTKFPKALIEIYLNPENNNSRQYYSSSIRGLLTGIEVLGLPEVLKNGKFIKDEIYRFLSLLSPENAVKPSKKYRNVMCHCDLWPANIFIRYDKNGKAQDAKIIDYQMERYMPPALDVMYYIYLHTTREYRKEHLSKLKKLYYDLFCQVLAEYGVNPFKIYTFEEFLDSFKEIEMFAILLETNTIPTVFNHNFSLNDVTDPEERKSLIIVDRSPLYNNIKSNKYFMGRVRDCLLDMIEYFGNN